MQRFSDIFIVSLSPEPSFPILLPLNQLTSPRVWVNHILMPQIHSTLPILAPSFTPSPENAPTIFPFVFSWKFLNFFHGKEGQLSFLHIGVNLQDICLLKACQRYFWSFPYSGFPSLFFGLTYPFIYWSINNHRLLNSGEHTVCGVSPMTLCDFSCFIRTSHKWPWERLQASFGPFVFFWAMLSF